MPTIDTDQAFDTDQALLATTAEREASGAAEAARLGALRALAIMDTGPDAQFDAVCALAKTMFGVPTVLVSLIEADRQWFKARCGFAAESSPRDVSFCNHAIAADEVFVVEDAKEDPRFADNPLVTDSPRIRFYAGAPLILQPDVRVGTVCVIDEVPRAFSPEARAQLAHFATIVVGLLRLHQANARQEEDIRERETRQATAAHQAEELRRSEAALRESNRIHRLLADNSTDMIVRIALDGTRLFVSTASRELIGYKPEELVGTKPRDSIHPDDAARFDAMLAELIAGSRDSSTVTNRLRHKDGRWIWVEAKWRALRDGDGRAVEFVASVRDIAARREAEEKLQSSEALYRTLADSLPQMVWVARAGDRRVLYANRQFFDYYGNIGADRDERVSRTHPDDVADVEATWTRAGLEGRTAQAEGRLRRHDGVYRWHKIIATPLRRDSAVVEWLGTALDIDEIIAARQRVIETSDLLALTQEAAGAGFFDIDLVTGASIISNESAAMLGFESDDAGEAVPIHLADWAARLDPVDAARALDLVEQACRTRQTYSAEFRVPLPGGEVRWVHGIGRAHYDQAGNAVRMIGLNFDITARKASEARLIEASAAAEEARREAEQASAAKSEFLARMSHEIRTPLNSVIGYTDVLLDGRHHRPDDRRQLEMIQESGSALLTVVNDILDFSKIEAGQIDLDPVAFSLPALIDNVVSMVAGLAQMKGLTIQRHIAPDVSPAVVGDPNRLRQVMLNLLNNAVKFTAEGGVTLEVVREPSPPDICRLRVTVTDTGIGISEDRLERLFHRFSQVDGSISRRFGGTGLGLAISKSLVDLMRGAIGVESTEGRGSSFWFRVALPVVDAAVVTADIGAPRGTAAVPARILLVEDVIVNQDLARVVLEACGHHVDVASDGFEAIQKVQAGTFDLVLMDIQMPGMDGMTASRRIRAMDHPCKTIPIVAMTANVLPQQIAAFKAAGMNDHVGKPFRRADLYATVARWMPVDDRAHAPVPARPMESDSTTLDELRAMLGDAMCVTLLRKLAVDIEARLAPLSPALDRARLARDAHALIASAGSLGFTSFSHLCRDVEIACKTGDDLTEPVERLRSGRDRVLHEIETLHAPPLPATA